MELLRAYLSLLVNSFILWFFPKGPGNQIVLYKQIPDIVKLFPLRLSHLALVTLPYLHGENFIYIQDQLITPSFRSL